MKGDFMKMKFFACMFMIVLIGTIAWQSPKSIAQREESQFSNLKLEISATKEKYLQLEPIPISFTVSNPTSDFIVGHTSFNLTANKTNLLVKNESGEEKIFNGFSPLPKQVGIRPRPVKPGESHQVENILNYRLNEMFPSPGKYQVKAIFYNALSKEKAFSNFINIEILAPEGLDKDAYDFINQSPNLSMFFTGGMVSLEKQERIWGKFLVNYDKTVYGDYVTYSLGEHFFYTGKHQEAVKQFEKLSNKDKFVLSEKASDYIRKIQRK